eukprot:scaffold12017_cov120-Isochrysis_galbana.AAC.17
MDGSTAPSTPLPTRISSQPAPAAGEEQAPPTFSAVSTRATPSQAAEAEAESSACAEIVFFWSMSSRRGDVASDAEARSALSWEVMLCSAFEPSQMSPRASAASKRLTASCMSQSSCSVSRTRRADASSSRIRPRLTTTPCTRCCSSSCETASMPARSAPISCATCSPSASVAFTSACDEATRSISRVSVASMRRRTLSRLECSGAPVSCDGSSSSIARRRKARSVASAAASPRPILARARASRRGTRRRR